MLSLSAHRADFPLHRPYALSFTTVHTLESVFVTLKDGDELLGVGEVTPLPGYGKETIDVAMAALERAAKSLSDGMALNDALDLIATNSPMSVSALACAFEHLAGGTFYRRPLVQPRPLVFGVEGADVDNVRESAEFGKTAGYRSFKMKVGASRIQVDVERVRACAAVLGENREIRLDANQGLSFEDALTLCQSVEDLPVAHLEQPFAPYAWNETRQLCRETRLPIALDESIDDADDVVRAHDCGVAAVKMKLCKHRGFGQTSEVIAQARDLGLKVIFGNGVQTSLGNHLEALLHESLALEEAGEFNGFLRLRNAPFDGAFNARGGMLYSGGLATLRSSLAEWPHVFAFPVNPQ